MTTYIKIFHINMDMDKDRAKEMIYVLTLLLDILLIMVLQTNQLNCFDTNFVMSVLSLHVLFYLAIYYEANNIIDYLHFLIIVYLILGLLLNNKWLVLLCFSLVVVIQCLWVYYDVCIVNKVSHVDFGMSHEIGVLFRLLSISYFLKLMLE